MRMILKTVLTKFAALVFGGVVAFTVSAQSLPDWTLVWADEFAQADGTSPDSTKWGYDIGDSGWGNSELQYYTSRTNNVRVEGGQLVIEVQQENYGSRTNTSARLLTKGKWSWTYGRIEARIKIPRGQGIWPAFWMLGTNIDSGVAWPNCGEIDIMENIGREPAIVHGTVHGPGFSGGNGISGPYSLPGGATFADDFHTYAVEWTTNQIKWFVDSQQYFTVAPNTPSNLTTWVFTQPQFLLLNVAVGGQWPGYPDGTTTFPQRMTVDYVRVYTRSAINGCAVPPTIENLSPNGSTPFVNPTNQLSFQAVSACAGIATNGVQVVLNGADVSSLLVITGSAANRNVSFSGLATNLLYSAAITITDTNGLSTFNSWQFDTFSQTNFIWEAEDFDYGSGQFINNPIPSSTAKANSYFGRVGQPNIDKNETSFDGERLYRAADPVATLLPTDFTRQKFLNAISAGDVNAKDYEVGYFYPGEWLNYTRTFPTGDYRICGRLAGGLGATQLYLDRVTAGQGTASQTTVRLGSFSFTGGGWQTFNFVPLSDANGVPVTVSLSGNATLRITSTGGADPNYFMLVPTLTPVAAFAARSGSNIVISFLSQAGLPYLIRYKNSLPGGAWQTLVTVIGDGTIKSVVDSLSANSRFYQVVAQ